MALIIPPDHYQCLVPLKHSGLLRSAAITFGVRTVPGIENPQSIADDVLVATSSAWQAELDDEVTAGPVVVTFDQGGGARGSIVGTSSFVGGADRNSMAPNTAVLLRKNTGRVGRPGRGRVFFPWILDRLGVEETGSLAPSAVVNLQSKADAWLTALAARPSELEMVILHEDGTPGGVTPSLVTSLTVDDRVGTQRRRNR